MVAGQEIDEEDLRLLVQPRLAALQKQEYEIKRSALDQMIERKLLEVEADRQHLTVEQLLQQEANSKIPNPSAGEVEAYYQGQKDRLNRPFEQIQSQLAQSLKQARIDHARQAFVEQLREHTEVLVLLQPPRLEVSYDQARLRGEPRAPVVIVEFSDFQCPHCRAAQNAITQVLAAYRGKVSLAFRDFPVSQLHPQALFAAQAARCAGEQGKFWEYHDKLFSSQKLDRETLLGYALSLAMDQGKFDACLRSGKFNAQIEQDFRDGQGAGVSGTPAFFVNGIYLEGEQTVTGLERVIAQELTVVSGRPSQ